MSFLSKQFIDVIQWTEPEDGILAYRYPMEDMEIQNGGKLTVRESQMAVFVNEGKIADVFGPGLYTLTTQTLPILTYLMNWDKAFKSPFKSDVYYFSTRVADGSALGHRDPHHHSRQGIRRSSHARLRHLLLQDRRSEGLSSENQRHARDLSRRGSGRPAPQHHRRAHDRYVRAKHRPVPGHGRQPARARHRKSPKT